MADWTLASDVPELASVLSDSGIASAPSFAVISTSATPKKRHDDPVAPGNTALASSGKYCHACGTVLDQRAEICPHCGVRQGGTTHKSGPNRITAFVLAWFVFGAFGSHKFYLGQTGMGLFYLLMSLFFIWTIVVPVVFAFVAFVEGIIYLTTSDEDFARQYG